MQARGQFRSYHAYTALMPHSVPNALRPGTLLEGPSGLAACIEEEYNINLVWFTCTRSKGRDGDRARALRTGLH
jgi:hypothetical protein